MKTINSHSYNNQDSASPTKKKLIAEIHKHYPNLNDKDLSNTLVSINRFVNLIKRLRTEPQAQIVYRDVKVNGESQKDRIITTDIEELVKVAGKPGDIKKALDKLQEYFPEKKNGRRSKKL